MNLTKAQARVIRAMKSGGRLRCVPGERGGLMTYVATANEITYISLESLRALVSKGIVCETNSSSPMKRRYRLVRVDGEGEHS